MAVATATALLIAAAATAAAGTATAVQANQSRQDAKGAANTQKDAMNKAANDAASESQKANDLSTSTALRDASKQRQQAIVGNSLGRGSTILTGGLGVSSPAATAQKGLLGQ